MIRDANTLDAGSVLDADVCIIGAGAAGITIARELSGSGLSVLLLEAGGTEQEPRHQDIYAGTMSGTGTWALNIMRSRQLGGTTNLWAGWCRPFRPRDFEPRPWMDRSGWPISYDDVRPYYSRAAEILEIGPFTWDAHAIAASEGKTPLFAPDSDVITEIFQYSPPVRFGEKYRSDLESGEDLQVLLQASVTRIQLNAGGDRVERVHCATLDGRHFQATARRFVLATGGIENARLLLASNQEVSAGVANGSGQVGRCFMEHPHYIRVLGIVTPRPLDLAFYKRHNASLAAEGEDSVVTSIMGVFGLSASVREAEQIPDWTGSIREYDLDDSGIDEISPERILALAPDAPDPRLYKLTARVEQSPDPDSRITLTDERDALGLPRVDLHWKVKTSDQERIRRAFEIFGAELARHGLGRVWVPRRDDGTLAWGPGPGGHHMGTTRMGSDPSTSVVDASCACHEVPNLFIAGSSLYATGASANPTFTITALALRLADHLKDTR